MKSLKQLIEDPTSPYAGLRGAGKNPVEKNKFVTREYQDYGYRLSVELNDPTHKSLYIKMAKEMDRSILEQARRFVLDSKADNKGALFMWKIKEIKKVGK